MATIKSSTEIDEIFRSGKRVAHPLVIALVATNATGRDRNGRVAFIAGKRLGGAVTRNRAKRLLRAAAQRAGAPWPGSDVLLIAREATLAAKAQDVAGAINQVVRRAGLLP